MGGERACQIRPLLRLDHARDTAFLIHFHQGGEETAQRAAVLAEDVHARLAPRLKWEPKDKTRIVLVDAMDEANGYATPIPYNQMVLFFTPPGGAQGFGLMAYDDWLRLLITHEYTHVLHLDMGLGGRNDRLPADPQDG